MPETAGSASKPKYVAPEAHGAKLRNSSNMPALLRLKAAKVAKNIGKKVPAKVAAKKGLEGKGRESAVGAASKPNYAIVVGAVLLFTFSFLYAMLRQAKVLD